MKKYIVPALFSIAFVFLLMSLSPNIPLQNQLTTPTLTAIVPTKAVETPWQTYRNEKYGFEFQYPVNNLTLTKFKFDDQSGSFTIGNREKYDPNVNEEQFFITGRIVSKISTPKEMIQSLDDLNSVHLLDNPNLIYGFIGDPPYSTYTTYFPLQNKKYLEVNIETAFENDKKWKSIAVQILSTFKFLPDTSTWKTYKNTQYGFEFKIPREYKVTEYKNDFLGFDMWGIVVSDTSKKIEDMTGKMVDSPRFNITLSSNFPYDSDANTPKEKLILGNNMFQTYQATKYEMYDVFLYEINNLQIINYSSNELLINPNYGQILSTFKFTK